MLRAFFAALTAVALVGPAVAQRVYIVGADAGGIPQLGYFDLNTIAGGNVAYTRVTGSISGLNSGVNVIQGLAFNPGNTRTYLLTLNDGGGSNGAGSGVYTLNPATGAATRVATVYEPGSPPFTPSNLPGLAFTATGTAYSFISSNDRLITISLTSAPPGQFSSAPNQWGFSSDFTAKGKLAFAGSGGNVLYGTMNSDTTDGLYSFNTTTGVAAYLGNGGQPALYADMMTFGSGSSLYGIEGTGTGKRLYQINTTTGALTTLAAFTGANVPNQFVAATVIPVPEPAGVLAVAAAAGLAWRRMSFGRVA